MDGYEVDTTTLVSAAGTLRAVADRAAEAIPALNRLGGDLGPGGLSERVRDLAEGWQDDVRTARDGLEAAAAATQVSASEYRTGDELARHDF